MKMLLAVDGSEYSRRAADYVVKHASALAQPPEVHLLYVHPAMPLPGAAAAVGKRAVTKYQREEAEKALAVAEKELKASKLAFKSSWRTGEIARVLGEYIAENGIDLLVMGSRGRGALEGLALGSTTMKVLASLKTPALIIR